MLHMFALGLQPASSHHIQLKKPQPTPACSLLTPFSHVSAPAIPLPAQTQPRGKPQERGHRAVHGHGAACHGTYPCAGHLQWPGLPMGPRCQLDTCPSAGEGPTEASLGALRATAAIIPPPFTSERHRQSSHLHSLMAARAPSRHIPGGRSPSLTPRRACLYPSLIAAFLLEQLLRASPEPESVGTGASGSARKRLASDSITSFIHCTTGPGRGCHVKAMPYTSLSSLAEELLESTSAPAGVEQHGSDPATWRPGGMAASVPPQHYAAMISDRPLG